MRYESLSILFLLFHYYLPSKEGINVTLHSNKRESPLWKVAFCQVWLKLALVFLEEKILKLCQYIFAILSLFPFGQGCGPSFEQT